MHCCSGIPRNFCPGGSLCDALKKDALKLTAGHPPTLGWRQRLQVAVAIARALVKQPALLILDEATSALDNTSEKLVQGTLDGLQKQGDLTIISIAHRLATIQQADQIVVLERNQPAESGSWEQLQSHGYLKRMLASH